MASCVPEDYYVSTDQIVTIVGASVALLCIGVSFWKPVRDHLRWRREYKAAVRQMKHGIDTGDDGEFSAGLRRLARGCGINETEDS